MNRVVYLHGFASGPSSSKARFFRGALEAAGIEVVVPDLAAGDFEHLTLTGQMRVIERSTAGGSCALVGSSMGGYLAALYAARHSEISRLVLLAPAFDFVRRWNERAGAAEMEEWRRKGSAEVYHYGEGRNCALHYGLMEDAARYEPWPDFRQPALIFHGAHDEVVPAQLSQQFATARRHVQLEIVDSGHELLNVLEEIGPTVVEFLRERST